MRRPALFLLTTLLLAGCQQSASGPPIPAQPTVPTPTPATQMVVGAPIAVTFSGLDRALPSVSVRSLGQFKGQALTNTGGVTVGSTPTVRSSTDIIPPGQARTAGYRYLHVTLPVSVTGAAITNLTLLGAALTGNSADSAVLSLEKYPGGTAAPYTSAELSTLAAAIDPASPVTQDIFTQTPALVPGEEDALQLYGESDISGLTLPSGQTGSVLPYGFVGHAGASRTIPVGTDTGTVTLSIKIPLQAQAKDDPYTVALTFVPVQDTVTSITESPQAQLPGNQAAFQAAIDRLGTPVLKTLPGTTRTGTIFCSVRTAGAANAATASLAGSVAPVSLAVGATARIPANATACLTGGAGGAEYTIIPFNTSITASRSLTVTTSNTTATVGAQSLQEGGPVRTLSADRSTPAGLTLAGIQTQQTLNSQVTTERATSPLARLQPQGLPSGVPPVGSQVVIETGMGCAETPSPRTGTVRVVGLNAVLVTDDLNPAGGLSLLEYQEIVDTVTNVIWPSITENLGLPADADNNGGRVVLFYTSAVNAMTPAVNGYSLARDEYATASCALSNVGEVIYLAAADPTGSVNSNVRTVSFIKGQAPPVISRELARVINNSRRIRDTGAPLEEAWLSEGLADSAVEFGFYKATNMSTLGTAITPGLNPRSNIALGDLTTGSNASRRVGAFNTYVNLDYGLYRTFLQNPNQIGPYWVNPSTANLTNAGRGAAWNFLRYAVDRYVQTTAKTEASFWKALVDSNTTGLTNLQGVLGADPVTWMNDWAVAVYADDAVPAIASVFNAPSWNYRSVFGGLGGFPLNRRALTSGTPLTLSYEKTSASYLRARVNANQQAGVTVTSPAPGDFTVTVLRTQ